MLEKEGVMRFRTAGFAGYLLSALIVLLLAVFPGVALYFYLLTPPYLVSIVLRFLAWRGIAKAVVSKLFKVISVSLLTLGILFILLIFLTFAEVFQFFIFVVPWVVYSLLEAAGYISLGRMGSKLAYLGVLNIPAVIGLAYLLTTATIISETSPSLSLVRVFLTLLTASALAVAFSLKRLTPLTGFHTPTIHTTEGASMLTPHYEDYADSIQQEETRSSEVDEEYQRSRETGRRRLTIEVISGSDDLVCRVCGGLNPVDARVCRICGKKPYLEGPGARCPVCRAPLVYATRLDEDRLLCGVCFSELQIIR